MSCNNWGCWKVPHLQHTLQTLIQGWVWPAVPKSKPPPNSVVVWFWEMVPLMLSACGARGKSDVSRQLPCGWDLSVELKGALGLWEIKILPLWRSVFSNTPEQRTGLDLLLATVFPEDLTSPVLLHDWKYVCLVTKCNHFQLEIGCTPFTLGRILADQ